MSGVGHLALDAWMRPVATPDQPFRIGPNQCFMKWPRIGIIRRGAAEAMGARQFRPAPAVTDRAQQALKTRGCRAGARIGAAHVIDHDGQAERFQRWHCLRQILDGDPELKMPSELRHHWRKRLRRSHRYAAAIMQLPVAEKMIESQSTNAEF